MTVWAIVYRSGLYNTSILRVLWFMEWLYSTNITVRSSRSAAALTLLVCCCCIVASTVPVVAAAAANPSILLPSYCPPLGAAARHSIEEASPPSGPSRLRQLLKTIQYQTHPSGRIEELQITSVPAKIWGGGMQRRHHQLEWQQGQGQEGRQQQQLQKQQQQKGCSSGSVDNGDGTAEAGQKQQQGQQGQQGQGQQQQQHGRRWQWGRFCHLEWIRNGIPLEIAEGRVPDVPAVMYASLPQHKETDRAWNSPW